MAVYTTIDDPSVFFQAELYTGTGSSNAVTLDGATNLSPAILWIHNRSSAEGPDIYDVIRGVTSRMRTNGNGVESDQSANSVSAIGTDGFTVLTNSSVNTDGDLYVAYCWKAGTTSGIGTSGQNITPSGYSINTTSKIGIYAYTGNGTDDSQINHGLGVTPNFMIVKSRSLDNNWTVFHRKNTSAPETDYLVLNTTIATADTDTVWSDQLPDTTDFTLGSGSGVNTSGATYVAYLFADVQGYSKFGGYTGNGNADGTFVYTGFRPAFLMIKRTATAENWHIYDSEREGYNQANDYLRANSNSSEDGSDGHLDILSNGFKSRHTDVGINASGDNYVYAAFAEAPFVNSEGVPCNAR